MTEKAFRFDFIIAIAALLVSAMGAFTLVYQTRVIGQQYAATIWPYLSVNSSYSPHGVTIQVSNDGVGPALVQSAQLLIDGKPAPNWGVYLQALQSSNASHKHHQASISASNFGRSTAIRPGDTRLLFGLAYKDTIDARVLMAHSIGLRLCYCSINDSCWNVVATPGKDRPDVPQSVASCTENTSISSDL